MIIAWRRLLLPIYILNVVKIITDAVYASSLFFSLQEVSDEFNLLFFISEVIMQHWNDFFFSCTERFLTIAYYLSCTNQIKHIFLLLVPSWMHENIKRINNMPGGGGEKFILIFVSQFSNYSLSTFFLLLILNFDTINCISIEITQYKHKDINLSFNNFSCNCWNWTICTLCVLTIKLLFLFRTLSFWKKHRREFYDILSLSY